MKLNIVSIFCFSGCFFSACFFPAAPEIVEISIEPPAPEWINLVQSWDVELSDGRCFTFSSGKSLEIQVDRTENLVVLARATGVYGYFRPFGGLYPRDAQNGRLVLRAAQGYEGTLASLLAKAGMDWARFDTGRFRDEAINRLGDPWIIHPESLAKGIADGTFRVSLLSLPPRFIITIDALGESLVSESPFGQMLTVDSSGRGVVSLPAGSFRYFCSSGCLEIQVFPNGSHAEVFRILPFRASSP
jgi:hypothetical protein